MVCSQILCKIFLKLKVTTIILCNAPIFSAKNIKTVKYILQTISYITPKLWDLVPKEMKQVTALIEFKAKIKIRKLENCPCRLYRTYLPLIAFII